MANFSLFYVLIYRQFFLFKDSVSYMALLLIIILSIGSLAQGDHTQNPPPKRDEQTATQSKDKKETRLDRAKTAENGKPKASMPIVQEDETGVPGTLNNERKKVTELQQRGIEIALQVGEEAKPLDVDELDQRTYLLFEIARRALGDNNRTRALGLLEEAARRAGDGDDTPEKVKALLGIANLYRKVDQVYSFNLAEAAVRAANRVPSDKMTLGEDDGMLSRTISYGGGTSTNRTNAEGFDTRNVFRALAGYDFDRTLAIAQSLEIKNVRCRAMLAVAESALIKK
jgi:hypothetical protein